MKAARSLLVLSLVAVLGVVVARRWSSGGRSPVMGEQRARVDPPGTSALREVAPIGGGGGRVEAAASSPASDSFEPRAAGGDSSCAVRVRFVDVHGAPVAGVQLNLVEGDVAPARSGRDGGATLDLGGACAAAPGRLLTLEARCAGFAVHQRRARAVEGQELLLGDWPLASAGTVEGRVVDDEGRGIGRVEVACLSETLTPRDWERLRRADLGVLGRPGVSALTTPDGGFRLEEVPAGEIRIVAVAEDRPAALSEPIEVLIGGLARDVTLEMGASDGGTTITGIVLAPDGSSVPGAPYSVHSSVSEYRLHAGPDGRFEFRALDQRPVDLVAADPEKRHRDAARQGVLPGTHGIELRLIEAPDARLTVRASGGGPIERYSLAVIAPGSRQVLSFLPEDVRAGGAISIAVPQEEFLLEVRANGWKAGRVGPFPADEPRQVECVLEPARGLHGTVTAGSRPLPGARVALHEVLTTDDKHNGFPIRIVPRHAGATESGIDGAYLLSVEALGEYSLLVEADGFALTEVGPLTLTPDTEHELDVELGPGGALSVRVRSTRGASVAGRLVAFSRGDGRAWTQRANEHGELELELLTPGPWMVALVDQEIDPSGGARIFGAAPLGEIPSNCRVHPGRTTPVDLWLDGPGGEACQLSGRLVIDGVPADGWQVALDRDESVVLDALAFREPGAFHVGVTEAGRYRLRLSPSALDPSAMLVVLDTVDLTEGERTWSLDLRTGILAGVLSDVGAEALLFWRVQDGTREFLAPLVPGPDGRFRCQLAPAGKGEVVRYDPSLPLGEQHAVPLQQLTIEAGKTTTLER